MVPWTWWPFDYAGENREATKELKDLFDEENPFDAPKPTKLVRRLLSLVAAKDGDIFLDFFAGSGTFAHAVMAANAEDGIDRRFIAVLSRAAKTQKAAERGSRTLRRSRWSDFAAAARRS
jgi:adenine-specific DNA-methyltransferase